MRGEGVVPSDGREGRPADHPAAARADCAESRLRHHTRRPQLLDQGHSPRRQSARPAEVARLAGERRYRLLPRHPAAIALAGRLQLLGRPTADLPPTAAGPAPDDLAGRNLGNGVHDQPLSGHAGAGGHEVRSAGRAVCRLPVPRGQDRSASARDVPAAHVRFARPDRRSDVPRGGGAGGQRGHALRQRQGDGQHSRLQHAAGGGHHQRGQTGQERARWSCCATSSRSWTRRT